MLIRMSILFFLPVCPCACLTSFILAEILVCHCGYLDVTVEKNVIDLSYIEKIIQHRKSPELSPLYMSSFFILFYPFILFYNILSV